MGGFCFLFHWTSKFCGRGQPAWVRATRGSRRAFHRQASSRHVILSVQKLSDSVCFSLDEHHRKCFYPTLSPKGQIGNQACVCPGYNKIPWIFHWCGWRHSGWSLEFDLIQETITLHTLKKSRMSSLNLSQSHGSTGFAQNAYWYFIRGNVAEFPITDSQWRHDPPSVVMEAM